LNVIFLDADTSPFFNLFVLYLNISTRQDMGSASNGITDGCTIEPIAIIGMSSKFSGDATNTEKLWRMLAEGRSGWTPFPASRFKPEGVYHPNNERLNSVSKAFNLNPNP
jgi:hypothetical protein